MQRSTRGEAGVEYWMKWQVPVCGLIMLIPAAAAAYSLINNSKRSRDLKCHHLWMTSWRHLHPIWLLLFRASAFVTMAYLLYHMLLYAGLFAFFFYTQWTFTLAMLYFALGTFISAKGCWMNTQSSENNILSRSGVQANGSTALKNHTSTATAHHQAGFLGSLLLIIYQTSAGASILTDLVFWIILMPMLSKSQFQLTLVIACIHSVNFVFLAIDSLLNALPFQWLGFNYFIIWTVTYAAFQWVSHACCTTWWPYPFLELSTPWAPVWYLGIAVIHVPCYAIYVLLVKAKNSIFAQMFPQAFVRSHDGQSHLNKTD